MLRHGLSCVFKSLVEGGPDFIRWNGAIDLLPVDEERGCGTYAQFVRLYGGGHDASTYFAPFALGPTRQFLGERLGQ